MGVIDFILNIAGVLLWLSWRAIPFDPAVKRAPATLVGTLRRAEPQRLRRWHFLAGLAALLLLRALLYWQVGSAVSWAPNLRLGAIAVPFRSDFYGRMLLYSIFSFVVALAVFYLWLLLLSLVNCQIAETDPLQRLVRLHLGRTDRWPWPVKLLLPLFFALVLWFLLSYLLVHWKIIPPAPSQLHRVEQALIIGLGCYLTWKYLVGSLLALYLLSSYVYLGNQSFWEFIALTGRNLLLPFGWLPFPLRLGKIDFCPLVGITLVFVGAQFAERGLTLLYGRLLM